MCGAQGYVCRTRFTGDKRTCRGISQSSWPNPTRAARRCKSAPLAYGLCPDEVDPHRLAALVTMDDIFPNLEFRIYA